jgi:hypothetical protein
MIDCKKMLHTYVAQEARRLSAEVPLGIRKRERKSKHGKHGSNIAI